MYKRTQLMIAALAMAGFSGLANAGYITTTFNSGMNTNVVGATVVDFNSRWFSKFLEAKTSQRTSWIDTSPSSRLRFATESLRIEHVFVEC